MLETWTIQQKFDFYNSNLVRLDGFYGISILVSYLMPNPLYKYILYMYDLFFGGFMAYQLL